VVGPKEPDGKSWVLGRAGVIHRMRLEIIGESLPESILFQFGADVAGDNIPIEGKPRGTDILRGPRDFSRAVQVDLLRPHLPCGNAPE